MLYLDDFCESVETLPQDMKHYMSHLRSLDLRVKNTVDNFQREFKTLCNKAPMLQPDAISREYAKLQTEFTKAFDTAEEKVQLATQTHDIVVRQLKRLEHELKKFEVELAANSRHGLIADLKEQSLVLDINNTSPQGLSLAAQRRKHKRHTPEPVPEYREAVSMPVMQHMPDPQPSPRGRPSTYKKKEKVVERVVEEIPQAMQAIPQHTDHLLHLQKIKEADPNEPRYCVCNQVSYGDMVGCDNDDCENGEWFHYACVGLQQEPKGKWFCSDACDPKRRKNRH